MNVYDLPAPILEGVAEEIGLSYVIYRYDWWRWVLEKWKTYLEAVGFFDIEITKDPDSFEVAIRARVNALTYLRERKLIEDHRSIYALLLQGHHSYIRITHNQDEYGPSATTTVETFNRLSGNWRKIREDRAKHTALVIEIHQFIENVQVEIGRDFCTAWDQVTKPKTIIRIAELNGLDLRGYVVKTINRLYRQVLTDNEDTTNDIVWNVIDVIRWLILNRAEIFDTRHEKFREFEDISFFQTFHAAALVAMMDALQYALLPEVIALLDQE